MPGSGLAMIKPELFFSALETLLDIPYKTPLII
jgi:hypothetical protein